MQGFGNAIGRQIIGEFAAGCGLMVLCGLGVWKAIDVAIWIASHLRWE